MPKKLSYNDVKTFIDKTGEQLLSPVYINNKTKLDIKCKKGHIYSMTFNDFKSGHRCKYCIQGTHTYVEHKDYYELKLTGYKRNGSILFDKDFYEFVSKHRWRIKSNGYAITDIKIGDKRVTKYLHQLILESNKTVDHINRNVLDNRLVNLRVADYSEQGHNRGLQSNNTSGYTGVYITDSKCVARIKVKDTHISKTFSYTKYSPKEALQKAIDCRKSWEKEFDVFKYKD